MIGGGRESYSTSDPIATSELRLVLYSDGLDPAEKFLDPLADAQAGLIRPRRGGLDATDRHRPFWIAFFECPPPASATCFQPAAS